MKIKAILIIVVTLVIGFILGMLTSAQLRHSKMKEVRRFVSGKDYAEMMIEVIQPDEAQKARLDEVMSRFYKTTRGMQSDFRNDFDSVTTQFKREIDTLLTKEQLEKVRELEARNKEMMQRMRMEPREHYRPGGPPPRQGGGRPD
ncbi:MAG: hypothetical protein IH593_11405 [Bacteroidales bacterium]|nr:hypothetical protein [Bacteroidales bacterium]